MPRAKLGLSTRYVARDVFFINQRFIYRSSHSISLVETAERSEASTYNYTNMVFQLVSRIDEDKKTDKLMLSDYRRPKDIRSIIGTTDALPAFQEMVHSNSNQLNRDPLWNIFGRAVVAEWLKELWRPSAIYISIPNFKSIQILEVGRIKLARFDYRQRDRQTDGQRDRATEGGLAPAADGDMPVGGPKTPQQIAAQRRLQQTQAQVDEVVDIMKTNVEKVLERDQKLSELDDRADALQHGASQFEQQAGKLKSKFWLQNLKCKHCCFTAGLASKMVVAKVLPPATISYKYKATEGGLAPAADGDMPVGGPKTPQQIAAQRRLQQTQAQVDEVVDIMKTNVEKVLERDQKLSELDDRADALQHGASQFEQQAGKLKSKFWLQNLKMMIIAAVIGIVILALIIVTLEEEEYMH
ncbi:hypothetical protein MSG28_011938 [Choristoneura fumiferana]|uniref:Uncharacterized protein n=1 Tax=Choristoneura fumiferana TaxID=7141 RepID=A0ACC0KMF0_CHOFU|nr:hypothetical protein MSG28_011938 [Choristoneura fumiferana]